MGMSDRIEAFITELLRDDSDNWVQIKRNELASLFGCAPSQINYVLQTRFSPDKGYAIESRRGGGGCLKIKKIKSGDGITRHTITLTGDSIDEKTARSFIDNLLKQEIITEREANIITSATSDSVLSLDRDARDKVRANILKNMLSKL